MRKTSHFYFIEIQWFFKIQGNLSFFVFCWFFTYVSQKAVDEAEVLCHAGGQLCSLLGTELWCLHGALNLDECVEHLSAEDVAASGEVEHREVFLGVEALVLAEEVGVRTVATVADKPSDVAEELLLSVPGDLGACCEELLDLLAGSLVGVHGEEERCDLLLCVSDDVADVERLVCLDVAVGGGVTACDADDVLTCLVRLVLDVALDVVLVDVVGEPRVVADDGGGLCVGESDDGLELHHCATADAVVRLFLRHNALF